MYVYFVFAASGVHSEMNNGNPIDTSVVTTVDKILEPLREEAVNHASKQLSAYISAKARVRQKKAKKSVTSAIVLDDAQTVDTTETKWWIESLNLLDLDKQTLTSGAWLNASIIKYGST